MAAPQTQSTKALSRPPSVDPLEPHQRPPRPVATVDQFRDHYIYLLWKHRHNNEEPRPTLGELQMATGWSRSHCRRLRTQLERDLIPSELLSRPPN